MSFLDEARVIKQYSVSMTFMEGESLSNIKAKFAALPDVVPTGKLLIISVQVELHDMEVE